MTVETALSTLILLVLVGGALIHIITNVNNIEKYVERNMERELTEEEKELKEGVWIGLVLLSVIEGVAVAIWFFNVLSSLKSDYLY